MTSIPSYAHRISKYLRANGISDDMETAIILGSGLGDFATHIEDPRAFSYSDIPGMPQTSVTGHDGTLLTGTVNDHQIIAFAGRFHYYEGFSFEQTALPVYLAKLLGIEKLIISNAAGAINTSFSVGDLMVIEDVIRGNAMISPSGQQRHAYRHHQWVDSVRSIAADLKLPTQRGTYMYVKGPNYETKAEIRYFRRLGADAVGMSTAPELFEAARLELKSVAISLISNMASGVTDGKLDHEEVKAAADARRSDFARLVKALIERL
ncbi:purine-nucleoside phosphorylase [Fodinibius sediminis]|uniref:Purine nucleoside phosphorylase n=1 Tax=Fodinibius sediminis TaxID=1214077 RepID=A0A521DS27_9BACT|nr:purine-nucleoside phosphorylase [Fodinibius sediminis]SMO74385.1 purine-nucleoside phosphorylase [Fodinibius sediminis]